MAGDWIKVEMTTPDKPEVISMSAALDIDQDAVVGKLLRIWIWADEQSINGNGLSVTCSFLNRLVFCDGFATAMENVGWLKIEDGLISFPRFDRHNGKSAKQRAMNNRRVSKSRNKCNDNVTVTPLQKALPEKRREEKSIIPPTPSRGIDGGVKISDLHKRIIRCITPGCRFTSKRDKAEMRAWANAKGQITPEDVAAVEWFYRLKKSPKQDFTWNRKTGVAALLNQWTSQVEYALAMKNNPKTSHNQMPMVKKANLPEPPDWKQRVPTHIAERGWDFICQNDPFLAKRIENGETIEKSNPDDLR